ncbi:MAG: conjugal transfer protein TraG N-terminal domain-containing protein [Candidatus Thiodiazotropha sp.]
MFEVFVGSLFEIYTTMYGWSLYNTFYDLLSITGILYFPFLMTLYHNWKKPYESQEGKAASVTSQRRMQVAVVTLIMAFIFAVLPVINLNLGDISYHKVCNDGGAAVVTDHTAGTEATVYTDNVGSDLDATRVPMYWWFLLSFSSGVNNAASSGVACFEDIKGLDQQLRNLTIREPSLREEYTRFANECYLPAKSRLFAGLNGRLGEDFQNYVTNQLNLLAPDGDPDPLYIGSDFLLQTPGFYEWSSYTPETCATTLSGCSFRARRTVSHWPYNATRDVNHSETDVTAGLPGMPYCDEWWETTANGTDGQPLGLKYKLLNSTERASTDITDWDDDMGIIWNTRRILENTYALTFSDEELERLTISRYTDREPPPMTDDQFFRSAEVVNNSLSAGGYAAGLAVAAESAALPILGAAATYAAIDVANTLKDFYLTMFILKSAAPFAQAVLLMMMYALMIFYLVVSEYDLEAILLMTFLILAVRFFTPLWDIADYLDARLFSAMYPDPLNELSTTLTQGVNRVILDMVMTVNYIVVPVVLFAIMGMAAAKLGKAAGAMDTLTKPLERTGSGVGKIPRR